MSGARQLRVLDIFSGIGGFSLGLERAGMRTVAFCEIEPYCRAVLRKHWPDVPCFGDVRTLHAADVGPVDVICGGFPCQDISAAGKGAGLRGERSGLWSEYRRLIEECRPAWVVIENVSALRSRGLDTVLGEISALGYDAEWHCISAASVGAPHIRDRVWIVAYSGRECDESGRAGGLSAGEAGSMQSKVGEQRLRIAPSNSGQDVADADQLGTYGSWPCDEGRHQPADSGQLLAHAISERGCGGDAEREDAEDARQSPGRARSRSWDAEPDVGRVANGVPSRVDRLRALGNAVVPQIPEIIGRAIIEAEGLMAVNIHTAKE